MKKILASILLITMILISTAHMAQASEDALDIEKAAIKTIENSQVLETYNKQVSLMKRNYVETKGQMAQLRALLPYFGSYDMVKSIILTPQVLENYLTQLNGNQVVITNAVKVSAYSGYIDLLKANYAVATQEDLMSSLYEDYKKIRLQNEQGMATEIELKLAEMAYEQTRYNYLNAQNSKDSAAIVLNNMMGEEIAKKYSIVQDNNIIPSKEIQSLEEYTKQALANRVEISNAKSDLELMKEQYRYGLAEIPTDYEFYKQQQEYEIDKAENDLDLTVIDVKQNIAEVYTGLESSVKKMEAMRYLAEQAESNYQAAQIRHETSQTTLVELNNVKIAKVQADINLKDAELDAWLMQITMDLACGAGFQPKLN